MHHIRLAAALPLALLAPGWALAQCADLSEAAPEGVTLTETTEMPAGEEAPVAHCLVRGTMDERTGTDGKTYAIGFELRLPEDWSGRFMHQFNGGADGSVVPALGQMSQLGPDQGALARGFAVVSSNAGHDGSANPDAGLAGGTRFGQDFEARRDYGYDAVATLHPVALALTEAQYGRAPDYIYGMGGSNGGRHAMIAAERMPEAFDGLLAGYPGFNLPRAALQHPWDVQSFLSVADTLPEAFSRDELALVSAAVSQACDGLDGLEDGLVYATMQCQEAFDPQSLACTEGDGADCLPQEKVDALTRIHGGPRNSAGEQLYSDWPWDTGISSNDWRFWKLESGIPPWGGQPLIAVMGAGSLAEVFTTPPTSVEGTPEALQDFLTGFDFDEDAPKIDATTEAFPESPMEVMTPPDADDPTLAEFREADGKLIVFHGVSDPVFSFFDTLDWYEALQENTGGTEGTVRLYAVPGLPHGSGGAAPDRFDMLGALIDWVEEGEAPEEVTATVRSDNEEAPEALRGAERILCPWPQIAVYGEGDVSAAESFSCEEPA
ncbi:tannase/feruloyl esterase family alpha/beta hydrolase [Histidinibacterium aquaticum]|uniref:Tannase/feruloyl esterase family alpha/beta hydrolase n=1 Tax=Histidinibacterium aquaticum TaxID=2613962 RepID=A0A5J5GBK4_9RHOB|nr:tannase/feruloyl esterase family alpha/beta hydrolase [Histidinibacterium aquaticum]KAA9005182.1 tannase/feruloyl esterase family alpha/beta hydrolase [Histidinibacterium aquaticum]